jgi:hypothetical protein
VKGLQELGGKHHATAGQVTLAWPLAQGKDIIPIPSTKKIKILSPYISTFFTLERLMYFPLVSQREFNCFKGQTHTCRGCGSQRNRVQIAMLMLFKETGTLHMPCNVSLNLNFICAMVIFEYSEANPQ